MGHFVFRDKFSLFCLVLVSRVLFLISDHNKYIICSRSLDTQPGYYLTMTYIVNLAATFAFSHLCAHLLHHLPSKLLILHKDVSQCRVYRLLLLCHHAYPLNFASIIIFFLLSPW